MTKTHATQTHKLVVKQYRIPINEKTDLFLPVFHSLWLNYQRLLPFSITKDNLVGGEAINRKFKNRKFN